MSNIDDRIVFMQFDNAAFERRLAETVKSLNTLNKTIEDAGKNKGLTNVGKQAKQIDFDPASKSAQGLLDHIKGFRMHTMVDQVSSVSASFLAMSTIAVTALSQVTQAALGAGAQVAKAMTISPVMDGLSEYETNMNSIQTIAANTASKGTTMDEINAALEELNEYSDKTIYNFAQMAKNIGAFTAAGIDLDTSVNAIKGIANLSAMSGASAEDSARASYQISQALAAGKMTLMDWNSMVNANIGGEVFKKTLFETGKALGTITDVPIDATFEEWEKAGGSFRDQLSKEWINEDVLTTALSTFTGDLSREQLRSLGYTEEQTKALLKQANVAVKAATEIKTFTQLIGAVKESIGTGWATSFRLVIGDFEEAKALWTGIYGLVTGIVGNMAKARNKELLNWKDVGGRQKALEGLLYAIDGIRKLLDPVRLAFREIFPRKTAGDLYNITMRFREWAKYLKPTADQTKKIHTLFKGFFAALKVGWAIVARGVQMIKNLWDVSSGGEGVMNLLMSLANFFINFEKNALGPMGSIDQFFTNLAMWIRDPMSAIEDLQKFLTDFFKKISTSEGVAEQLGALGERFGFLKGVVRMLGMAGQFVMNLFGNFPDAMRKAWSKIQDFFHGIGDALSTLGSEGAGNAENAGKIIGLGLLGGIFWQLRKLLKDGLPAGDGIKDLIKGTLEKLNTALDGLTDTLKAMQTKLKADALKSIAIAIGILAIAVILLSSVDPKDLTKAFVALGVGLGQLVGVMKLLDTFGTNMGAVKLLVIAAAIGVLALAMTVMALAVKAMGSLDLKTIGKGLLGIGGALLIMAGFMKLIQGNTSGIIRTGVGLIFLSIALLILSKAVEAFGNMDWDVMKQGLLGVGVALLVIAAAMWAMPPGMLSQAVALIGIAIALNILRVAVEGFGNMKWEVLKQGMIAVAVALGMIALAAWAMPPNLLLVAAGVLVMSVALNILGAAIAGLGNMAPMDLVKGIAALAVALLAIGVAAYFMGNPAVLLGAVAITILAGAMLALSFAIEMLSNLSVGQLAAGVGALLVMLLGLGLISAVLSPLSPAILSFAGSMLVLGASIALIGFGMQMFGEGLAALAKAGPKAFDTLIKGIKKFLKALPDMVASFFESIDAMIKGFIAILPSLLKLIEEVVVGILDILIAAVPKIVKLLAEIIKGLVKIVKEEGPGLIEALVALFDALVTSVAAHAESIAQGLIDILVTIMDTVAKNAGDITESLGNMIVKIFEGLTDQVDPVVTALVAFLVEVFESIAENVDDLVTAYVGIMLAIFKSIGDNAADLVTGFVGMLVKVLEAILDGMDDIVNAFVDIVVSMIKRTANAVERISTAVGVLMKAIGDAMITEAKDSVELLEAGREAIETFADGLDSNLGAICRAAGRIMGRLILCIPEAFGGLISVGAEAIGSFILGLSKRIGELLGQGATMVGNVVSGISGALSTVIGIGAGVVGMFISGIMSLWSTISGVGANIIGALQSGVSGAWDGFITFLEGLWNAVPETLRKIWEVFSPSRRFMRIGNYAGTGLVIGMKKGLAPLDSIAGAAAESAVNTLGNRTSSAVIDAQKKLAMGFEGIGLFNPVIKPGLDLSSVELEARRLGDILDYAKIDTNAAFLQASEIASVAMESLSAQQAPGSSETVINLEQNNYSPVALPAKYIFRKTKSVMAKAKAELEIP